MSWLMVALYYSPCLLFPLVWLYDWNRSRKFDKFMRENSTYWGKK